MFDYESPKDKEPVDPTGGAHNWCHIGVRVLALYLAG